MNKKAFTLSEVLITLAIIGVVAAITLPSLIAKHQEKVTVTKLKKVYSTLSQAFLMAVTEYGPPYDWESYSYEDENDETVSRFYADNLVNQISKIKDCGFKSEGCFAEDYKKLNGGSERDFENLNNRYYKFIISDGMACAIEGYEPDPRGKTDTSSYGEIWVDINGKKGPNTCGKDLFLFVYTAQQVLPYSYTAPETYTYLKSTCSTSSSGYGCSTWVLAKKNLEYLRCNDLTWTGKTKCSD